MRKLRILKTFSLLALIGSSYLLNAATVTRLAVDEADWNYAAGWDCNCIPSMVDDVIINGQYVFIDSYAEARSVTLDNSADGPTALLVSGYLEVSNDFNMVKTNNFNQDVFLSIQNSGSIDVNGSFYHERTANDTGDGLLSLEIMGQASLNVMGDINFSKLSGLIDETQLELFMTEQANLFVNGGFNGVLTNGSDLEFVVTDDANVTVMGDMDIDNESSGFLAFIAQDNAKVNVTGEYRVNNSGGNGNTITLTDISGDAEFLVGKDVKLSTDLLFDQLDIMVSDQGIFQTGNIVFDNVISNSIDLDFTGQSELHITGNVDRTQGTGSIEMVDQSKIVFMGTETQTMPAPYVADEDYSGDNILLNFVGVQNPNGIIVETSANGETAIDKIDLILGAVYLTNQQSLLIESDDLQAITFDQGGFIFVDEEDGFTTDKEIEVDSRSTVDPFGSAVIWNTGLNTGSFQIPVMTDEGLSIPVIVSSDQALGEIRISTYETETTGAPNNRPLPNDVTNLDFNGNEAAEYCLDRFWKIESAINSNVNVEFHYSDNDLANNPLLVESTLKLHKWDEANQNWTELPNSLSTPAENKIVTTTENPEGIYVAGTVSAVIPVEWLSFNAETNNAFVQLDWATASEINSDYFEIQRSADAQRWNLVGKVAAQGFSNSETDYQYTDQTPYSGVNYYRLKQYDTNGLFSYSDIKKVNLDDARSAMNVYPNPVSGNKMSLSLDQEIAVGSAINVYDRIGQVVKQYEVLDSGKNLIELDLQTLNNGIYYIELVNASMKVSKTFVIEH